MTDARQNILKRLRSGGQPEPWPGREEERLPVDPVEDDVPAALEARFVEEAQKASVVVLPAANEAQALSHVNDVVGDERLVLGWSAENVPLSGYAAWLAQSGISLVQEPDGGAKIGITGADAALSTTGSLILLSGQGKPRAPSLLPDTHLAIVRRDRIIANLESWLAQQRVAGVHAIRDASNVVIITGPSRTADIGMELVMGAHGPRKLFVVLV